jgi:hypothetical protein
MPRKPMTNGNAADGDVVEISLLLPQWQVTALETAAHDSGLTAAEMVRLLLHAYIARLPAARPDTLLASVGNGKSY